MAIGLTVVLLLSGCSRQISDTASSPEGGGTTSSEPIKQYIASVIKDNDDPRATYPMTKAQREILKRSEAAGGVSSTDYAPQTRSGKTTEGAGLDQGKRLLDGLLCFSSRYR